MLQVRIRKKLKAIKRKAKKKWRKIFRGRAAPIEHDKYFVLDGGNIQFEEATDFCDASETDIKCIAFYLPQYHPIPENDLWWGKGFTEWTNVTKASPLFNGHNQPRLPGDLGFYDLRLVENIKEQVDLAKQHGIYGFCFYYYWFSGQTLLTKPIDLILEDKSIEFPFCLCWANENWTRRWDGNYKDILMEQKYTAGDPEKFIRSLSKYLKDSRYIRVDNKPLIVVYKTEDIPRFNKTMEEWREKCLSLGVGEIFIAAVLWRRVDQSNCKVDAFLEFPPNSLDVKTVSQPSPKVASGIYDYNSIALSSACENYEARTVFKGVMLEWDNTARKGKQANLFVNYNAARYGRWLHTACIDTRRRLPEDKRLVFINAWNEWAEGSYLEPDRRSGCAALNATSRAIRPEKEKTRNIAVVLHLFYEDLIEEIIGYLTNIPFVYDLYVTVPPDIYDKAQFAFNQAVKGLVCIEVVDNRGRDIAPFLLHHNRHYSRYDAVCKIHSKKSHFDGGEIWRESLFNDLLGSENTVKNIVDQFFENDALGIICPSYYALIRPFMVSDGNFLNMEGIAKKMGIQVSLNEGVLVDFPAGSMFWFRPDALAPLFKLKLTLADFEVEAGQLDGTLAHAVERLFITVSKSAGYKCFQTQADNFISI
jgi:lipopolysaccharide biosynthesis protein